jgi:predicted XRE-type DNA-binding protein
MGSSSEEQNMRQTKLKAKTHGVVNGVAFEVGSGNVFTDLGLPDAEERQTKACLAAQIADLLAGINQKEAAALLGLDQPKVSKLLRGQLHGFSTDRLMGFLTVLGQNVEIRISPASRSRTARSKPGHISVITGSFAHA